MSIIFPSHSFLSPLYNQRDREVISTNLLTLSIVSVPFPLLFFHSSLLLFFSPCVLRRRDRETGERDRVLLLRGEGTGEPKTVNGKGAPPIGGRGHDPTGLKFSEPRSVDGGCVEYLFDRYLG
jgi:hypothetical protein